MLSFLKCLANAQQLLCYQRTSFFTLHLRPPVPTDSYKVSLSEHMNTAVFETHLQLMDADIYLRPISHRDEGL